LGTGTGAIVLALASEKKFWDLVGVDQSADAVKLAEINRQQLEFTNVQILQSDWFNNIPAQTFDVIVSNPPYIDPADPHLSQGDVQFEPRSALVAGNHGLADIEKIIFESKSWLKKDGWLCIEHGYDQAMAAQKIFIDNGYSNIQTRKDLGGNDRITFGQIS
jgi:release factor glutamine methyltransferase